MGISENFHKRFNSFVSLRNISVNELSSGIGLSPSTITRISQGVYIPKLNEVEKIAEVLNISVFDLIYDEKEIKKKPTITLEEASMIIHNYFKKKNK